MKIALAWDKTEEGGSRFATDSIRCIAAECARGISLAGPLTRRAEWPAFSLEHEISGKREAVKGKDGPPAATQPKSLKHKPLVKIKMAEM